MSASALSSAIFEVEVEAEEEAEEAEEAEEEEEAARTQSQKSATEVSRCTQFPSHIGPGAAGAAVARRWKRAVAVRVPQTAFSVVGFQRRAAQWSMHPPITAGRPARTMLRSSASDGLWWKDAGERCRWPGGGISVGRVGVGDRRSLRPAASLVYSVGRKVVESMG